MIRVGLLGVGFIGATHAACYKNIAGARLVAVADVNREAADRVAAEHDARAYYAVEPLLEDKEVDVVDVCLPTFLHEQAVVSAAEAGKDILCEKPIARSLSEVDHMLGAVRRAGVKCMVAQVVRFWPQYAAIKELLDMGRIGQPWMATASRLTSFPGWSTWFGDPALSGGAILDLHIHDLDYVFYLFGRPGRVYAVGHADASGAWNQVVTTLYYGDKAAVAEASFMMPPGFPFTATFRLVGTQGCVEYRFRVGGQVDQRDVATTEFTLYRPDQPPESPLCSDQDPYLAEIEYFVDCVMQGKHPEVATLEEARAVLQIALAAQESLEHGRVVTLKY